MIYLDNGATTRPFPNHYNFWLNSHSSYSDGDMMLWKCRERIAKCINAKPNEIYFTGGGCEGNTWCINILRDMLERPVLVSKYEHKSIINNPRVITSNDIDNLDSCMLVNNETGIMFDVNSLHKDCVQGLGKVKIDVNELYNKYSTIMCSFSGHKIHGEKGVGFVWIKDSVIIKLNGKIFNIKPLIYGGGQEFGVRGGTTPLNNILHMTDCIEIITSEEHLEKNHKLYMQFMNNIVERDIYPNLLRFNTIPDIPTFSLKNTKGINGEYIVNRLAEKEIYISTGSACSTGEPSHVLTAMGLTKEEADSTIRVSLDGEENCEDDIIEFFNELEEIINGYN